MASELSEIDLLRKQVKAWETWQHAWVLNKEAPWPGFSSFLDPRKRVEELERSLGAALERLEAGEPSVPPCQICGEPSIGVACSSCGPISIAYCAECATGHREPWGLMVACCSMLDRDGVADWLKPPIAATLAYYGKTEDELWAEADAALDDYCAHG